MYWSLSFDFYAHTNLLVLVEIMGIDMKATERNETNIKSDKRKCQPNRKVKITDVVCDMKIAGSDVNSTGSDVNLTGSDIPNSFKTIPS